MDTQTKTNKRLQIIDLFFKNEKPIYHMKSFEPQYIQGGRPYYEGPGIKYVNIIFDKEIPAWGLINDLNENIQNILCIHRYKIALTTERKLCLPKPFVKEIKEEDFKLNICSINSNGEYERQEDIFLNSNNEVKRALISLLKSGKLELNKWIYLFNYIERRVA